MSETHPTFTMHSRYTFDIIRLAMSRRLLFWLTPVIALLMAISMELVYSGNHGVHRTEIFPLVVDSALKCMTGLLIASAFFACRRVVISVWPGMVIGCLLVLLLAVPILNGYEALSSWILGANHLSAQPLSLIAGLAAPFGVHRGASLYEQPLERGTRA